MNDLLSLLWTNSITTNIFPYHLLSNCMVYLRNTSFNTGVWCLILPITSLLFRMPIKSHHILSIFAFQMCYNLMNICHLSYGDELRFSFISLSVISLFREKKLTLFCCFFLCVHNIIAGDLSMVRFTNFYLSLLDRWTKLYACLLSGRIYVVKYQIGKFWVHSQLLTQLTHWKNVWTWKGRKGTGKRRRQASQESSAW